MRAGAEDTEVLKRKRGTFGTRLRPPLSLPDGDKMTVLGLDLNGSRISQLEMRRDGHLALFWHLQAALTSKGTVRLGWDGAKPEVWAWKKPTAPGGD